MPVPKVSVLERVDCIHIKKPTVNLQQLKGRKVFIITWYVKGVPFANESYDKEESKNG